MREISILCQMRNILLNSLSEFVRLIKTGIRPVVPLCYSRIDGNISALQRTRSDDNKVAILRYRVSSSNLIALVGRTKLS